MTSATDTVRSERIYAIYLLVQAVAGIGLWLVFGFAPAARKVFELSPERHAVMDAFVFADIVIVVVGSVVSAWAIDRGKDWAVPVIAFTAGAIVYPTLYLVGWVAFTGVGAACLGIMVPVAILTTWVAYQTWRASR